MRKQIFSIIGLAALMSSAALAATASLAVSAAVVANCTIGTSAVAFGNYVTGSNSDANGAVNLTCTNGTAYTVTLGQGGTTNLSSSDSAPLRQLAATGGHTLNYNLFTDAPGGLVWTNDGTNNMTGTSTGTTSLTVYGRIPSGQSVYVGTYSDTVVATVTF